MQGNRRLLCWASLKFSTLSVFLFVGDEKNCVPLKGGGEFVRDCVVDADGRLAAVLGLEGLKLRIGFYGPDLPGVVVSSSQKFYSGCAHFS